MKPKSASIRIGLYQPYPHTVGGLQSVVIELARALPEHGYDPLIICPEEGAFTEVLQRQNLAYLICDPGVEWHVYGRDARMLSYLSSPLRILKLLSYWLKLRRDLKFHRVSLLHCNDYRGVILAAPAARLAKIPVIWHMHGYVPSLLANMVTPTLVEWTVPVSAGMLDYLKLPTRFLGRYRVIHNGINQPLNSCETTAAFKTREHPIVLAAGRLHPRKAYETLIDAFAQVSKRIPLAECRIVGGDFGDGSYGRSLQVQARACGLCESIKFCGYSSNVRNDMEKASLLVVPSRIEAFGMVAIEAMSLGLPVVACRTGGLQEIVAHGETGLLVPPGDSAQMAYAIIQILSNPSLAKRMGQAGKSRVQEFFTTHRMTASFANFYETVLKQVA